jgi:hypothetical protein
MHKELLQWLIDFEALDLAASTPADLDRIGRELDRFRTVRVPGPSGMSVIVDSGGAPRAEPIFSAAEIRAVQQRVRTFLTAVRPRVPWEAPEWYSLPVLPAIGVSTVGAQQIVSAIRAPWPQGFWVVVWALVLRYGTQLRRCEARQGAGTCGRLFLRTRRQLFCSQTCAQRERARRWYERHSA